MRKLIVLILCFCFAGIANAQGTCKYKKGDLEGKDDGRYVEVSTGQPANGILCLYDESGKLGIEMPYKNGVVDGVLKSYDKS